MCMGGKSQPAVINMPNTGAYDQMLATQRAAIQSTMNNGMMQAQQSLQAAIADQQRAYQELADQKTADANNQIAVSEQAMRMSQMMGPPPPEKSAEAPKIGDSDRYGVGAEGKKALRIGRGANKSGKGAGLNITGV